MSYQPPPMADVTAYSDHTVHPPGWDEITVIVGNDEKITPTEEEIAQWATQYVGTASGKAYAKHIWTEWNDYEPEGDLSIGGFLRDTLDSWRGTDAPPASAPQGSAYLSEDEVRHNQRQLGRISKSEGARSVKLAGPGGQTQWLRITDAVFRRLKDILTSPH